ncbi:MAG: ISAs1 family transposase, partial [Gemmatimonas sp.]|nr:ISAs1 family transposase [Gemmatimonas sp.]
MCAVPPSADGFVPSAPLLAQLAALPDPRVDRAKRHSLTDVLAIALLATLGGADNYSQFALFGRTRAAWLATFLALPNGIPSHDTFQRVLRALDPKAFAGWLTTWSQALAGTVPGVVAIDGKTARRSGDATTAALHTVSAWATAQHLT